MNVREAMIAALRRDPDLLPKVAAALRGRKEESDGPSAVVRAAEALEPIIADAVRKNPSKLNRLGLKSATVLASLAAEDRKSNSRLAKIARGSTVGIVFVDVAGFAGFTERNGDEAANVLIGRVSEIVERKVAPSKGECVKHLGDGFLLAFPSASQAVRGALDIRDAVGRTRGSDPSFDARLRIAVHAGEPLIEQDDLLGHDVNITARLLDHSEPGEIVISEAVRELAGRRLRKVSFSGKRWVKIRGLTTKVAIYSVERNGGGPGPPPNG
jgi:class 3 adenylate cyclase